MLRPDTEDVDLIFLEALSPITLSATPGVSDGALVVDSHCWNGTRRSIFLGDRRYLFTLKMGLTGTFQFLTFYLVLILKKSRLHQTNSS